jgi:hypothetical protein
MITKKPEDIELDLRHKVYIYYLLLRDLIYRGDEAILTGIGGTSLILFVQGIWYFILRHNSPANTDGVLPLLGCLSSAFFLSLITVASLVGAVMCLVTLEEKFGRDFREDYHTKELAIKKTLFEKIDKDLLGSDDES